MKRDFKLLFAAASLAGVAAVSAAQAPMPAAPQNPPAPIERAYPDQGDQGWYGPAGVRGDENQNAALSVGQLLATKNGTATARPAQGIIVRVGQNSAVREVTSDTQHLELRVERGIVNVNVHDPANDALLLLVDLPGGQTQILTNGLYTFNAGTNTMRVLKGEAQAYPAATPSAEPIKVKEYRAVVFSGTVQARDFAPQEASADLVGVPYNAGRYGDGGGYVPYGPYAYGGYAPYGYGPYGDGFYYGYPYPYAAYGYPWGWGYPYGWYGYGYPFGVGLSFGYWGGYRAGWGGGWGGWRGGGFRR
jgi:hypothetical protein